MTAAPAPPTNTSSTAGPIGTFRVEAEGAELHTVLVRPASAPVTAPILLWRTPYGTSAHLSEAFGWASRGYVVALQDVRGRFASTGRFEPYRHEGADGATTARWLRDRGLTGPLVGYGGSYAAHCVLELVGRVQLAAAIVTVPAIDHVACIRERSGAPRLYAHALWWAEHGDTAVPRGPVLPTLLAADPSALAGLPVADLPGRWGLDLPGFAGAWLDQPERVQGVAAFLQRLEHAPYPAPPMLCVGGWLDAFTDDMLDLWTGWPHPDATALIGTWGHSLGLAPDPASAITPATAHRVRLAPLMVDWLEQTLAANQNSGRLVLSAGRPLDGSETRRPWTEITGLPETSHTWDLTLSAHEFHADPERPHPSRLGQVTVTDLLAASMAEDSVVCRSPVLEEWTTLFGRPALHLSGLATDSTMDSGVAGPAIDWAVRLVAELADGTAVQLSTECVRTAQTEVSIDLPAVHLHLPPRSRLLVQISGHQFPLYPRDPQDGSDPLTATALHRARRRVDGPVRLDVPVMSPDEVTASGRDAAPTHLRPTRSAS